MDWIYLEDEKQLDKIKNDSQTTPQVIFKHSTRCATSSMAKHRLDKNNTPEGISFYFLDLIKHRNISNKIADDFKVVHQSPQVLIIHEGKCIYNESHSGIRFDEIEAAIMQE
jgi:bacillithiol system protein YtxJ